MSYCRTCIPLGTTNTTSRSDCQSCGYEVKGACTVIDRWTLSGEENSQRGEYYCDTHNEEAVKMQWIMQHGQ